MTARSLLELLMNHVVVLTEWPLEVLVTCHLQARASACTFASTFHPLL